MSLEQDRSAPPASTSAPASASAADVKLSGWKEQQVKKAVQSLLKWVGQQKDKSSTLFDEEEVLYMQIAFKKMPMQPRKDKPVPLPLPHPLYTTEGQSICLFVKDAADGQGGKDAKKKLAKLEKNGGVAKVVDTTKLRTKYESHEAKRKLCKSFDLFLADDRVLPSLPKLIGKSFFKKKKQPIPIDLRKSNWAAEVKKACACTYLFKGSGTCINIKVARSSFTAQQVEDNIHAALCAGVQHMPKKWANVQGVFLKTADSVALPLFQTLPDAPQKIAK
ncbi:Ribosomal L1 domain-containing protein 1 [Tetrabaena socialis]|uniref:Ribosomal L1 domain-containing protein 1 n=1 Tax=Tetrabaena socialis TaxID=47790 RepID=A0A2J8A2I7_9CHLO|nr:Ribosomal L1 domain-containing protein 1 [Tetrabaena socialis]|eukprot:PNH06723.1 Ribosomal L1 domain-containing protein 1 [Tetrabaena socialis]